MKICIWSFILFFYLAESFKFSLRNTVLIQSRAVCHKLSKQDLQHRDQLECVCKSQDWVGSLKCSNPSVQFQNERLWEWSILRDVHIIIILSQVCFSTCYLFIYYYLFIYLSINLAISSLSSLRQGPAMLLWLSQNSVFSTGWPLTNRDMPASASPVLGSKVCAYTQLRPYF